MHPLLTAGQSLWIVPNEQLSSFMDSIQLNLLPVSIDVHIITTSELHEPRAAGVPRKLLICKVIPKLHRGRFDLFCQIELFEGGSPCDCLVSWTIDPNDVTISLLLT